MNDNCTTNYATYFQPCLIVQVWKLIARLMIKSAVFEHNKILIYATKKNKQKTASVYIVILLFEINIYIHLKSWNILL